MNFLNIPKGDRTIWLLILILSFFSSLVVYSSSITLAYRYKDGHSEYFLLKHLSITLAGLFITYYIHKINLKKNHLNIIGIVGFIISIPLLVYTLLSGVRSGEATRWIEVPGLGITFQSSDIAKIALIIFIARNLAVYGEKLNTLKDLTIKIILPAAAVCTPILIANFSTAFLLFLTVLYLIMLSNVPIKVLFKLFGLLILTGALFVTSIYFFPNILPRGKTWKSRVENYLKGDNKSNYQVEQAKIAIANGVLIGKGPGNSAQRAFLPQAYSDFIYAIIIEEYGTLIGIMILGAFLIIFFRCIRIAQKVKNTFYAYIVMGLSFNLITQAFVNMSVAVNIFPVTGQPLPFMSMGGTSVIFSCITIGIILNISKQLQEEKEISEQTTFSNVYQTEVVTNG